MTDTIKSEYTTQGKRILTGLLDKGQWKDLLAKGKVIYKGRNEIRVLELNGYKVSVKKYGKPIIFNRILYSLGVRTPKALRSYRNAQQIMERGFQTAVPLGYEIHYKNGVLQDSYFVSLWAQGTPVGSVRKTGLLVRALAQYTVALHEKGLRHLDYAQHNILFTKQHNRYQFSLIDVNRFVFRSKPLGWLDTCLNLMQPFVGNKQLKIFVTEYAYARRVNKDALVWWVLCFRRLRNGYSDVKHLLRKLPGAHYFSRKAKRYSSKSASK